MKFFAESAYSVGEAVIDNEIEKLLIKGIIELCSPCDGEF
jgi:hypothetical protein